MSRGIYLENTPLDEALTRWVRRLDSEGVAKPISGEAIHVIDSLGRVTSEAVIAKISSPFYHSSAMDGYAVKFADTFGATERIPKRLKMGEQAVYVDTGDPIPEGFNAVIMIEDVNVIGNAECGVRNAELKSKIQNPKSEFIEIISPATPWQYVRVIGEDIMATELILPENPCRRSCRGDG
jgi:putative molybdopterin biosynthesis protein